MKYAYEDLGPSKFEDLVIAICQELFGIAVQGFANGPDGGRDAKFIGVADLFPSKVSPWLGTTIVQAKHTNGLNHSFSDPDFFSESSASCVIAEELQRIKKLRSENDLDNYLLFSNRRLTGNTDNKLKKYISKETGIPERSIYFCGVEQLEVWLKTFPKIPQKVDIDPVDSPLIVSPDELAEVIESLAEQRENFSNVPDAPPTERTKFDQKNELNNMTAGYAKTVRQRYLKETKQIQYFLSLPENYKLLKLYESIVDEFQLKIMSKRQSYQTFDALMEYLVDLLFNRDPVLSRNKKLTRTMLFYMYWNCDIGEGLNAQAI